MSRWHGPLFLLTINIINAMLDKMIILIAMVCHQANKAWCEANEDFSQVDWEEAPLWQQESAIKGVQFVIANPNADPDAQHNSWMAAKVADGWVYGPEKDAEKKTHPCIVPFDKLPEHQQRKDVLFHAIVTSLTKPLFNAVVTMDDDVRADKRLRVGLDSQLQELRKCPPSRERSLAITKLQEAIMWLGMDLKRLDTPNPYPNSYKPENTIIDKTADGLKL